MGDRRAVRSHGRVPPTFREPYLGLAGVRRYLSENLPAEENNQRRSLITMPPTRCTDLLSRSWVALRYIPGARAGFPLARFGDVPDVTRDFLLRR